MGTDDESLRASAALHARLDALLTRPPAGILAQPVQHQTLSLPDPATLLKAKITLAINRLMATYLSSWEDTADQHDESMGKLMDSLPAEHKGSMVLADSFGEARWDAVRRHVLKTGNEGIRELHETIDALHLHA
jgi:hypothetical protein